MACSGSLNAPVIKNRKANSTEKMEHQRFCPGGRLQPENQPIAEGYISLSICEVS